MQGRAYMWTPEMHEFCAKNTAMTRSELANAFNEKFNTDRISGTITGFCSRNGYLSDLDATFKKGNVPFNKGMKGVTSRGSEPTWFKIGGVPAGIRPVGSERLTSKPGEPSYWYVKVAHPNGWKLKHRIIWELENGPVPDGHIVIFIDSDTSNLEIKNLALVSRGELAILNKTYGWKDVPVSERATVLLMARLQYKTGSLAKQVEKAA